MNATSSDAEKLFAEADKETLIDLIRICPIKFIGTILKTLESRFLRIEDGKQAISWENFVAILENIPAGAISYQNNVLKWVWVSDHNDEGGKRVSPCLEGPGGFCPERELMLQLLNMPESTPEVRDWVWLMYREHKYFGSNDIILLRQIIRKPNLPCAEMAAEFLMEGPFPPKLQYSDLVWIIDNYPGSSCALSAQKLLDGKYVLIQSLINILKE